MVLAPGRMPRSWCYRPAAYLAARDGPPQCAPIVARMPYRTCSTNIDGSAVFYDDDGEWKQLTRGGDIPPGTLVVAVPYADEVQLPTVDEARAGQVLGGTWVFTIDHTSHIRCDVDGDSQDGGSEYPRSSAGELGEALVERIVGGTVARARDRLDALAGHTAELVASYTPDPSRPFGQFDDNSALARKADGYLRQLTRCEDDLMDGYDGVEGVDELYDQVSLIQCAAAFNVPVEVVERAKQRRFAPVGGIEDIVGPDVAVVERLFHVVVVRSYYNDEYYAQGSRTVESVWPTQEQAQARAMELEMKSRLRGMFEEREDVMVGSTEFDGSALCENSRAYAVWRQLPSSDYYGYDRGQVDEILVGVYPTKELAQAAHDRLGTFSTYYEDAEKQQRDALETSFGDEPQETLLCQGRQLGLPQGVRTSDGLWEAAANGIPEAEATGLPQGGMGVVRVNTDDDLQALGEQLAEHAHWAHA